MREVGFLLCMQSGIMLETKDNKRTDATFIGRSGSVTSKR